VKVTVQEPYNYDYGGKHYTSGSKLELPLGVIMQTPWVFKETQDEVTEDQRRFLDDAAEVQKAASDRLATVRSDEAVTT
jgi:hypothetical protein